MALLKYAGLRIALFLAVAALLYVVGVRNLLVNAMIAILISGVASLFLLDRVRDEAGATLESKWGASPMERVKNRIDAAATAEDAADDAARAARDESGVASDASDADIAPDTPGLRSPERPEGNPGDRNSS